MKRIIKKVDGKIEVEETVALKFDTDKVRMELLSVDFLTEVSKVLTFGAEKYDSHNWRKGFDWSRLYGAALRHLTSHMNGENVDGESGLSHLSHAACCLMFLIEHECRNLGNDDRYIHPQVTQLFSEEEHEVQDTECTSCGATVEEGTEYCDICDDRE